MKDIRSFLFGGAMLVFTLILLGLWQAFITDQQAFFFSKPSEIAAAFISYLQSGVAGDDFFASFLATLLGLLVGSAIGVLIGLVGLLLPLFQPPLRLFAAALAALPILAIAPMFLIWFGTGLALKVALATILVAIVIASEMLLLPSLVGRDLADFAAGNRLPRGFMVVKILIPYSTQRVLGRISECANVAFLGVFVGEFIAADRGIGYRILRSGSLYQIDRVWACALLVVVTLLAIQVIAIGSRNYFTKFVNLLSMSPILRRNSDLSGD